MIILKVTNNHGFTLSLEDTLFEKPQGEGQIDTPSRFSVNTVSKGLRVTKVVKHIKFEKVWGKFEAN